MDVSVIVVYGIFLNYSFVPSLSSDRLDMEDVKNPIIYLFMNSKDHISGEGLVNKDIKRIYSSNLFIDW